MRDWQELQFAGVTLDPAHARLRVDGRERPCPPLGLSLLRLCAERPGAWIGAAELRAELSRPQADTLDSRWRELILSLRAVLGAHGEHLEIDSQSRIRLNVPVRLLYADGRIEQRAVDDAPPAASAGDAAALADPAGSRLSTRLLVIPGLLILIAAILVWPSQRSGSDALPGGWSFHPEDFEQAETARLIGEALRFDAEDQRVRGASLLESLAGSGQHGRVPATLLALWAASAGNAASATRWMAQAEAVTPIRNPYLDVFGAYVQAELTGEVSTVMHEAERGLALRPDAWQFRRARAHLLMAAGNRSGALEELRRIEFQQLDHFKLSMALADRASLGDVAGVRTRLGALPEQPKGPHHDFLLGRLAWTEGDLPAARRHFGDAIRVASPSSTSLQLHARVNIGAIALLQGERDTALSELAMARADAVREGNVLQEIDLALMLLQIHEERGNQRERDAELGRAIEALGRFHGDPRIGALVCMEWARVGTGESVPATLAADHQNLVDARRSLRQGDPESAARLLDLAVAAGAYDGSLADEARLLSLQIHGTAPEEQVIDPPYPPLSRLATRRRIHLWRSEAR